MADCYGSPIPVTVTAVDMGDIQDLNVWRWRRDDAGQALPVIGEDGRPVLVDWPNPNIELVAADGRTFMTRQIRYRGSPGWTWPLYLAREA